MTNKSRALINIIEAAVTAEQKAEYTQYTRSLKTFLKSKLGFKARVNMSRLVATTSSVEPDPHIEVSVKNWKTDAVPNELRVIVAKVLGIKNVTNWDNVNYGNIRSGYITIRYSDWLEVVDVIKQSKATSKHALFGR